MPVTRSAAAKMANQIMSGLVSIPKKKVRAPLIVPTAATTSFSEPIGRKSDM